MTIATDLPQVLVIDDEMGPRESLRMLLKPNYQVYTAENVETGLRILREKRPDAVISDIRMPGTSGIDGLRKIREIDPHVAVIMLTGFGALETAKEALRLGANDYIFESAGIARPVRPHKRGCAAPIPSSFPKLPPRGGTMIGKHDSGVNSHESGYDRGVGMGAGGGAEGR